MSETENTEEEKIIVQADDDQPSQESSKQEVTPEEGIDELKRRLQQAESMRAAAERQAREAAYQVEQARLQAGAANYQQVQSAIQILKNEGAMLKQRYQEAASAGDHYAASEAMEQLNQATYKLDRLEVGAQAMREELEQAHNRRPEPLPPADPVEALASQLSARSAAWVRAHPEYARDPVLTKKMVAAHNFVTADGIEGDTDEYFAAVEQMLGVSGRQNTVQTRSSTTSSPSRQSPPPAPVSRGNSGSSNIVRLNKDQREMARNMGMTEEEYAKNLTVLKKEGRIN